MVHDAYVNIWRHARTFDPDKGSAKSWMGSIVRYRSLDVVRRRGREKLTGEAPPDVADELLPDALEMIAHNRDVTALYQCLDELDVEKITSILLAFIEGLSHGEIADRLDAPLGTVKSWIRRGLVSLKKCLEK